jgi:hypothetical protein
MADNVVTNPGSGGATFATDEIGGVHYPRTKLAHGADGQATDVSSASPLPVAADEATMATVVLLLSMILEKLPRVDGNDRVMVNASEVANAASPVTVSSGTVTTVSSVTGMSNLGASARPADAIPMHLSMAAASYIYDRIIFA